MFQTSCFLTILFTFQRKMSKEILSRSIGYRLKTAILSVSLIAVGLPSALAFPDNKVVATIPTSTGLPLGMAVSPNGKFVYVACRDGGAVDVINAATNKVIASIATGNGQSLLIPFSQGRRRRTGGRVRGLRRRGWVCSPVVSAWVVVPGCALPLGRIVGPS